MELITESMTECKIETIILVKAILFLLENIDKLGINKIEQDYPSKKEHIILVIKITCHTLISYSRFFSSVETRVCIGIGL